MGYTITADGINFYNPTVIDDEYKILNPKLTLELNKAGSLEFTLPPSNVVYDKIEKLKTLIIVRYNNEIIFRGRVLHDEKDFYKRKRIYVEGELAFLNDAVVRPYEYKGSVTTYFQRLINTYNTQCYSQEGNGLSDPKQFLYGNVTITDPNDYIVRSNSSYTSVLDEMTDKLLNNLGGYLVPRYYYAAAFLDYLVTPGKESEQTITFGENLLDITEYIDAQNVFTVLIPLGAEQEDEEGNKTGRLTIESVNDGKDYIENAAAIEIFGRIWKTATWDDVTVPSNLLNKARSFLNDNVSMAVTLSIKAVDLNLIDVDTERIKLGDSIRVVSKPHGIDTFFICSKMVIDMVSPDKTEFTLGAGFSAMTNQQVSILKNANQSLQLSQDALGAANSAANAVSGVTQNYVTMATFQAYQTQVNNKLTAVYHYKGTVASESALPVSDRSIGDVWNVEDTGANYAWTGTSWDKLSETVDLSGYATENELEKVKEDVSKIDLSGYAKTEDIPTDYVTMATFQALLQRVEKLESQ